MKLADDAPLARVALDEPLPQHEISLNRTDPKVRGIALVVFNGRLKRTTLGDIATPSVRSNEIVSPLGGDEV